jgi:ethanolamine utilization microcompartment shell protein EutL
MGCRRERYKNGVLISVEDTRVLSEEQDRLVEELKKSLGALLKLTDWEIVRASDPTSNTPVSAATITARQAARDLADSIEAEILAATELDDLKHINPNIYKQLK